VVLGGGHLLPTDQPLNSQAMIEDWVLEKGLFRSAFYSNVSRNSVYDGWCLARGRGGAEWAYSEWGETHFAELRNQVIMFVVCDLHFLFLFC
jgi:hypothetical protein